MSGVGEGATADESKTKRVAEGSRARRFLRRSARSLDVNRARPLCPIRQALSPAIRPSAPSGPKFARGHLPQSMSGLIAIIERRPQGATFAVFLALHVVVWTALPALLYPNLPLDLIEALTYGPRMAARL